MSWEGEGVGDNVGIYQRHFAADVTPGTQNDKLTGTAGDEYLFGNDRLFGKGGNDFLIGGYRARRKY